MIPGKRHREGLRPRETKSKKRKKTKKVHHPVNIGTYLFRTVINSVLKKFSQCLSLFLFQRIIREITRAETITLFLDDDTMICYWLEVT